MKRFILTVLVVCGCLFLLFCMVPLALHVVAVAGLAAYNHMSESEQVEVSEARVHPVVVDLPEVSSPAVAVRPLQAGTEVAEAAAVAHAVEPGDTLYGIARLYGTSVAELQRVNAIDSAATLRVGQVLAVTSTD